MMDLEKSLVAYRDNHIENRSWVTQMYADLVCLSRYMLAFTMWIFVTLMLTYALLFFSRNYGATGFVSFMVIYVVAAYRYMKNDKLHITKNLMVIVFSVMHAAATEKIFREVKTIVNNECGKNMEDVDEQVDMIASIIALHSMYTTLSKQFFTGTVIGGGGNAEQVTITIEDIVSTENYYIRALVEELQFRYDLDTYLP